MDIWSKLSLYAKSARVLGAPNIRGLPIIPKKLAPFAPSNRAAFNQFVLWISSLQLSKADWVIDVGANHGDFAQAASAVFPFAQVLLVEPLPQLQPTLQRHAQAHAGKWHVADIALSNQSGTATLFLDGQDDAIGSLAGFSDTYKEANPRAHAAQQITCRVDTLDQLCSNWKINEIDLLKIDVEGFEFEVMEGAAQILQRTRGLILELSLVRRSNDDQTLDNMLRKLRQAGFSPVQMVPSLYSKQQPWRPVEFNILARRH